MLLNGVSTQLLLTGKIELDNSAQLLVFTGSYAFMSLYYVKCVTEKSLCLKLIVE